MQVGRPRDSSLGPDRYQGAKISYKTDIFTTRNGYANDYGC